MEDLKSLVGTETEKITLRHSNDGVKDMVLSETRVRVKKLEKYECSRALEDLKSPVGTRTEKMTLRY